MSLLFFICEESYSDNARLDGKLLKDKFYNVIMLVTANIIVGTCRIAAFYLNSMLAIANKV